MTEKGKEFAAYLTNNPDAMEKLNAGAVEGADKMDTILKFAKQEGYELSAEDFKPEMGELAEEELMAVSGGGACFCQLGGGGTKTEMKDGRVVPACGCVLAGGGSNGVGGTRCWCIMLGPGDDY